MDAEKRAAWVGRLKEWMAEQIEEHWTDAELGEDKPVFQTNSHLFIIRRDNKRYQVELGDRVLPRGYSGGTAIPVSDVTHVMDGDNWLGKLNDWGGVLITEASGVPLIQRNS